MWMLSNLNSDQHILREKISMQAIIRFGWQTSIPQRLSEPYRIHCDYVIGSWKKFVL